MSRYEVRSFRPPNADDPALPDIASQYKPPSVWVEHRGVVIFFAVLCLGLTAYWIKSVRSGGDSPAMTAKPAAAPAAAPPESVYIELVPSKAASSAQ